MIKPTFTKNLKTRRAPPKEKKTILAAEADFSEGSVRKTRFPMGNLAGSSEGLRKSMFKREIEDGYFLSETLLQNHYFDGIDVFLGGRLKSHKGVFFEKNATYLSPLKLIGGKREEGNPLEGRGSCWRTVGLQVHQKKKGPPTIPCITLGFPSGVER